MHQHVNDPYVKEAQRQGYRSRAAFKLLELGAKDDLFRPGMRAVDLGAAPGSWSQVLARKLGPASTIVAIDLLAIDPIRGVTLVQGDFREAAALAALEAALGRADVDLVVSDLSPNLSGVGSADQARSIHLADLALEFAATHLQPGGDFAVKVFQGAGFSEFRGRVQRCFAKVYARKPEASRDRSREVFIVGKGFRGRNSAFPGGEVAVC